MQGCWLHLHSLRSPFALFAPTAVPDLTLQSCTVVVAVAVFPPPVSSSKQHITLTHIDAMADEKHQPAFQSSPSMTWGRNPHVYPHSHHGTPAQEYSTYHFPSPNLSLGTSTFENAMPQRPVHQQLQPLVMPQWPSMLNSHQSQPFQPAYPQPVQPIQPMTLAPLPTPISATSSRSGSTPRKTLTDLDRKQMCQYAEENPTAKQTEIGGMSFLSL